MNRLHNCIYGALACLLLTSCNLFNKKENAFSEEREKMEAEGQKYLTAAREALRSHDFDKAKAQIKDLRDKCPRAITARQQGILLSDSIELTQAQKELQRTDSLLQINRTIELEATFEELCEKVKFYHRKLQHDKSRIHSTQSNPTR